MNKNLMSQIIIVFNSNVEVHDFNYLEKQTINYIYINENQINYN